MGVVMFSEPQSGSSPEAGKPMTKAVTTQTVDLIKQRLIEARDLRRELLRDLEAWQLEAPSDKGWRQPRMHGPR